MRLLALCTLFLALPLLQSELIQVIQIARHGARTPNSFEFLPNQYNEKEGELTVLGIAQHYFLGQEMRKRYIEDTNFLQDAFNSSEVLIKSSWKNRTVRSALAFANGLYPQDNGVWLENKYAEGFEPDHMIPLKKKQNILNKNDIKGMKIDEEWAREVVDVIALDGDLYFHAAKDGNCPIAEKVTKEVKKSQEIVEMEKFLSLTLYPTLADGINSHLGHSLLKPESLNMKKAKSVLDNYRCNSFHGQDKPYIDKMTLDFLKKTRYFYAYKIMLVDEMVRTISASKLLEEFSRYMNALRDGTEGTPKFIFYSAHDTTLEILFSIFLLESQIAMEEHYNIIPFASVVGLELHREYEKVKGVNGTEIKEEYYVKMLYNDEPQFIKWCMGYECTLSQFDKILRHYIVPNIEDFCSAGKPQKVYQAEESYCVITSDGKGECQAK